MREASARAADVGGHRDTIERVQIPHAHSGSGCSSLDTFVALGSHVDCRIDLPYLLALDVPLHRAANGSYWADRSWAKDLARHCRYLTQLTLLLPVSEGTTPPGFVEVDLPGVKVVASRPLVRTAVHLLPHLPALVWRTAREIRRTRVVHTGVAGYPMPIGWLAVPIARILRRQLVILVESAFWRVPARTTATWPRRLRARCWEAVNRWCLRQADFAGYSHGDYQRSLPSPRAGGGVLFQASWIDADAVISEADADRRGHADVEEGRALRVLFAARLIREKGTQVLADCIDVLRRSAAHVSIDILGEGPELQILGRFDGMTIGTGRVTLLDPVPYGPVFLSLLRRYDAIVVPSLSDEQPRVVYDAGSQAVPTIASDLPGLRACVQDGQTGWLFPVGDASALAERLKSLRPEQARDLGRSARLRALEFTHDRMHDDRCRALSRVLADR